MRALFEFAEAALFGVVQVQAKLANSFEVDLFGVAVFRVFGKEAQVIFVIPNGEQGAIFFDFEVFEKLSDVDGKRGLHRNSRFNISRRRMRSFYALIIEEHEKKRESSRHLALGAIFVINY